MKKIEVLLVDDDALVRAAIKSLIDGLKDFAVVAEAVNIAEAMDGLVRAMPAVVVTDLRIGLENGLDLVRTLREQAPHIAAVVLSMDSAEACIAEALRRGAFAYVQKDQTQTELENAIRAAVRGDIYMSATATTKMIKWFVHSRNAVME